MSNAGVVIVRNAPMLRYLSIHGIDVDVPWEQLTSLRLAGNLPMGEEVRKIRPLRLCSALEALELTEDWTQFPNRAPALTLHSLRSLTTVHEFIIPLLTVPRLEHIRLDFWFIGDEAEQLQLLFVRSCCPLERVSLRLRPSTPLRFFIPTSITSLELLLSDESGTLQHLAETLQPITRLSTPQTYTHEVVAGRVALESFVFEVDEGRL
ncbi:hypothetical protein C8J57DRAFT_1594402 [Mycena rebaudengoi]|nr:hypothetical protein C8J57DRAFT_1594402 [Mycena rebaudengoi]